jgi:hypothetical protein
MEDSENGGKGDMQARNRTVVNLPREKVEREVLDSVVIKQPTSKMEFRPEFGSSHSAPQPGTIHK